MGGLFSKNKTIKFFKNKTITEFTEVKYFFNSEGQYKLKINLNVNLEKSPGSDLSIKLKNEKNNFMQNLYFTESVNINTELGNYPFIFEGATEVLINVNPKTSFKFKELSIQQIPLEKSNFGSSGENNYYLVIFLVILLLCYKQFKK